MFDIGLSEITLVFIIGLLVLGPERLPIAIRTVAKWIKSLRALAGGMQQVLAQELKINELQTQLQNEIKKLGESTHSVLNAEMQSELSELRKTVAELKQQLAQTTEINVYRDDRHSSHENNRPEKISRENLSHENSGDLNNHSRNITQPKNESTQPRTLFGVPIVEAEHEAEDDDDYYQIDAFYEPEPGKSAINDAYIEAHQALLNDPTNRLPSDQTIGIHGERNNTHNNESV